MKMRQALEYRGKDLSGSVVVHWKSIVWNQFIGFRKSFVG